MEIPVFNVVVLEEVIAVRYLGFAPDKMTGIVEHNQAELLLPTRFGPYWKNIDKKHIFNISGKHFVILGETIFCKSNEEVYFNFVPGTHFVFHFDPRNGARVDPKGALSFYTKCSTADLIRTLGGLWYFDIWVRNQDAPLTECARSITTAEGTLLITNLKDLGETWSAEDVMRGGQSKWLNLAYDLIPRANEIAPDESVEYLFRVLDGKTGEVATDVTWDGFEIEAVDGYVPHRRLFVVNGLGRFTGYALHLDRGDTMRVKIKRRYQTSVAEATVKIL